MKEIIIIRAMALGTAQQWLNKALSQNYRKMLSIWVWNHIFVRKYH